MLNTVYAISNVNNEILLFDKEGANEESKEFGVVGVWPPDSLSVDPQLSRVAVPYPRP